jgi:integrase
MKKTNIPGLNVHNNGIYYLRRQIPEVLRGYFKKGTHWKESLGVRDYQEAKPLFAVADARWQTRKKIAHAQIAAVSVGLTPEKAADIAMAFLLGDRRKPNSAQKASDRSAFALAMVASDIAKQHSLELERQAEACPRDHDGNPLPAPAIPFPDPIESLRREFERGDYHRAHVILPEVQKFAELPDTGLSRRETQMLSEALLAEMLKPEVHRQSVGPVTTWAAQMAAAPSSVSGTMREAFVLWQKFKMPNPGAVREYGTAVERFHDLFGDLPLHEVTARHGRIFRDAHMAIPAYLTEEERKRSFHDLYVHFDKAGHEERPSLAPASIKKYVGGLSAIFSAVLEEYDLDGNPMARIRLPGEKKGRVAAQTERRPFTDAHMQRIFSSPMFTGCEGEADFRRCLPGPNLYRDDLYWVFLLGAATGARLEELGQVLVSDVRTEKGVHFLWLDNLGEDQTLKTEGSRRRVPLHPKLVDLGFLQWAREGRSADQRVFRDVKLNSIDKLTHNLSRRANRYLDRIGIDERNYVFYSFRHKFKDECRDAEIPAAINDQLTGHYQPSVASKYGEGASLATLDRAIKRLKLPYFPQTGELIQAA